jgi:hypothetical protein
MLPVPPKLMSGGWVGLELGGTGACRDTPAETAMEIEMLIQFPDVLAKNNPLMF